MAEANVPYTELYDMDDINPEFKHTDVALVIGANDIVNPAARSDTDSPLYGMPILDVDHSHYSQAGGYVDTQQLNWLRNVLHAHSGEPTLAFMHHHAWPIDIEWLDVECIRNGNDVVGLFQEHGDVRWMICGHVHLDKAVQREGLTQLTSPSTCFQISKVSQVRKNYAGPPGFRVVRIKGLELTSQVLYLHADRNDAL